MQRSAAQSESSSRPRSGRGGQVGAGTRPDEDGRAHSVDAAARAVRRAGRARAACIRLPAPRPHCTGQLSMAFPKIELHVHLEGTVRPTTLLEIARRNDYPLPANTVEGLESLYQFRDFTHFIEVWILTTHAMRTADDFRQVVVD